ncbi:hypothetical protein ACN6LC_000180 [Streptomyces violaceoruber]|uniref:hypothetical protein n=1 Tax=Streptomyces TaxID=1883 RepID=UPI00109E580F|nr:MULTISPECIES: hypothetical protein [Streptomyces]MDX3400935.1 hypothetical protein [Streptomyces sp. ME01-18h]THA97770.1 hypothetical protein E6R61_10025 [Streptomyces sp. LRa12]WTE20816.1 hypothetical protein OH747_25660 [Streptomyces anthocyanicus]GGL27870.1 hypothetical protein GCM10010095_11120 [Streptomyces anthocyanicus]
MGLTYGYDVYLRPRNVAGALTAVAGLAPPSRDVPPLDVTLPGGERIVLPFTSGFGSEPVDCSARDTLDLDTSLMFPVDDVVRAYGESYGLPPEENGRVRIGYVYLTVRFRSFLDPGYAALEFWAPTSGISRLFERSASIRKTFTDLAAAVGGVCCQFDRGDGSPGEVCWVSGEAGFPPAPSSPTGSG